MEKIKIFDGEYGKMVKVIFELEFYVNDNFDEDKNDIDLEKITEEQVKKLIFDMERTDLGEQLLNNLDKAIIVK